MNNFLKRAMLPGIFAALAIFTGCEEDPMVPRFEGADATPEVNFTALTSDGRILYFEGGNLSNAARTLTLSNLASGEQIVSIDYRPATGQLYGLSSASRLYHINENSGVATALGQASFSPAFQGANPSLDFNPTVDRIRLVTESGQNLRLHPELGTVVATDGNINGGFRPRIGAVAYTNSFSGASSTILYDIDFEQDKLYQQVPPNDGGLVEVGNLQVDFEGEGDMDILPDNSLALAVTRYLNQSRLYTIDLSSGRANWVGVFTDPVISISFKTDPIAYAAVGATFYRFNPLNPSSQTMAPFTGLAMGETIVGLDYRPINGQLLAISNRSRLYSVNPSNAALNPIGQALSPAIAGNFVGFDFNPTVDRIRLVTETGQNLRLHPSLGTVVAVDGSLNPGSPFVTGAAYTNTFAGTTSTELFVIDSQSNRLLKQSPPNDGVLVDVGPLGVDFDADNGFDIGGTSNLAYAVLRVGNASAVYRINLMTGAATKVSDLNFNPTAMAVGQGF